MPFDGLSDDDIRHHAPSVFATHPSGKASSRYAYLPSYQVVRSMRSLGFSPACVREGTKRAPDGRQYALHEIRFQKDATAWADQTRELGMLVPEAVFRNSHDRTSGAEFSAGLQRLVCLNGMTVSENSMGFRANHVGRSLQDNFHTAVQGIVAQFGRSIEVARDWQKIDLTAEQVRAFAMTALEIRGSSIAVTEANVLHSRRFEDDGYDLWSVFNRAQENLTQGGLRGRSSKGAWRSMQGITSLAKDIDFNRSLWSAAAELAASVKA